MGGNSSKTVELTDGSSSSDSCLTFHCHRGKNVELSSDKTIAKRTKGFCFGIAFSSRSIEINELVFIKLHKVEDVWSGVMRFGVTSVDPSTLDSDSLPRYACPDLTSQPGFFAKALPEDASVQDNILSFYVTQNGFLRLWINNDDHGIFIGDIPTNVPLWVMTDIYGNTSSLQFMDKLPPSMSINPVEIINENDDSSSGSSSLNSIPSETNANMEEDFRRALGIPDITPAVPPDSIESIDDELRCVMELPPATQIEHKCFASKCGTGVRLREGRIACQMYSMYSQNPLVFAERALQSCLVFSADPLTSGKTIYFKILLTSLSSMDMMVGVTSCNPESLIPDLLPDDAAELVDREEYWVVDRIQCPLDNGDFISLTIRPCGLFLCKINNESEQEMFYCDTSQDLWIVLDLGSYVQELCLVGVSDSPMASDSPSTSAMNFFNEIPPLLIPSRRSGNDSPPSCPLGLSFRMQNHPESESPQVSPSDLPLRMHGHPESESPPIPPLHPLLQVQRSEFHPLSALIDFQLDNSDESIQDHPLNFNRLPYIRGPVTGRRALGSRFQNWFTESDTRSSVSSTDDDEDIFSRHGTNISERSLSQQQDDTTVTASAAKTAENQQELAAGSSNGGHTAAECSICLSASANAAIYDCGHVCMCLDCGKALVQRESFAKCPICRNTIKDIIKLYHS